MQFGISFASSIAAVDVTARAEELGYDVAWFYDTPLVCADPFVVMALAAQRTSRIQLGLGTAIPRLRMPHTLATGIGTLAQLAPGRIRLGFGTGYTGALTIGMSPSPWQEIVYQVGVCRDLLAGRETELRVEGEVRRVKHLHPARGFVDLTQDVPVYISALGPKGMDITADIADGFITITAGTRPTPEVVAKRIARVRDRARNPDLPAVLLTAVAVRGDGEPGDSERLRRFLGPWVTSHLHGLVGVQEDDPGTPAAVRVAAERYSAIAARHRPDAPWIENHEGHSIYVRPEEEELINAELLASTANVGTAEELIAEIRALEEAGVTELVWQVVPGFEAEVERFAREVIEPYRARFGA
jgi:5,10-methylenetetrahydromethanopterin reductase